MRILAILALCSVAARALPDARFDDSAKAPAPVASPKAPASAISEDDGRVWAEFETPGKAERNALVDAGISLEEIKPGRAAGFATPKALARAAAKGLKPAVKVSLRARFGKLDFPDKDSIYHNYKELEADLRGLAARAPDVASVLSIGKSTQGKDILAIRLNKGARGTQASAKPGIVFLGTHHAREHLSTEVPLLIAKHLVDNRAQPEIARLLETRDVYFVPMVNPDGVEYDIEGGRYHMHRKNMAKNADGSTGVDLNRNYSWGWGGGGASPHPDDDTYRGPSAFSEPESRAVRDFVEARPNLKVMLSYHTFSELILYPWGGSDEPIPDAKARAAFIAMAGEMSKMTGYTPQQSSDLYIATGDTCDWAWGAKGIYAFTFELTPKSMWDGGFYPGAGVVQRVLQANIRPALYLIDLADDPQRSIKGPSAFAAAAR
ncbi:MAG: M14 family metallopeptidase [Elusimicrobiota bacterium]|nr:MAG: M14 family metallopeptidase [Elusimicrobiota bacterium]